MNNTPKTLNDYALQLAAAVGGSVAGMCPSFALVAAPWGTLTLPGPATGTNWRRLCAKTVRIYAPEQPAQP